jgi:hypothetical protein
MRCGKGLDPADDDLPVNQAVIETHQAQTHGSTDLIDSLPCCTACWAATSGGSPRR